MKRRTGLVLVLLLVLLGFGGALMIELAQERNREQGEETSFRLAVTGAEAATLKMERTLEAVTTLHALTQLIWRQQLAGRPQEAGPIEAQLREIAAQERFGVLQVAIIDARGMLAWSTVPGWRAVDLSDREHFRVHRDGRREPFVSEPLVGRASNRWSLNVSRALADEAGGFAGVAVVSLDVATLSQELGSLRFAPEATVTLLRADGVVLAQNHGAAQILGRRLGEAQLAPLRTHHTGQTRMAGVISPRAAFTSWHQLDDWPLLVTYAIETAPFEEQLAHQHEERYLLLAIALVILGVTGALVNERQARARVREEAKRAEASRKDIATLLDALPGAVYRGIVEPGGNLRPLYVSPSLARITGWPEGTFVQEGSFTRLMEESARQTRAEFYRQAATAGEFATEYRARAASGGWVWVRDHCRSVQHLPGGQTEIVGLLSDITAERNLKAQALTTARLATLGEMATGVAHELNQPCATIALAADLAVIEIGQGSPEKLAAARRRLERIAQQTERMRDIIDHFRTFGQNDEGGEEAVDLLLAARRALGFAAGLLHAAEITPELHLPASLPPVRGRQTAIEQALVNVLINARDAMENLPPAARSLQVAASGEEGAVRLIVRDRGHGFSAEALERAFEPFYTTREVGRGTGLGLSIAYGTIRRFDGRILLRNRPEGGAEVEIVLPLAAAPAPGRALRAEAPGA